MFEFESFEEATVAAALLTGPRHRLVQCNRAFRALFGFWRCGQEAGVALAGSGLRPVLRALDRAGTDRSPALLDAAGVTAQGPPGHRFWVVSCLPVTSRHGASVLLLAVRAPDELGAPPCARRTQRIPTRTWRGTRPCTRPCLRWSGG